MKTAPLKSTGAKDPMYISVWKKRMIVILELVCNIIPGKVRLNVSNVKIC